MTTIKKTMYAALAAVIMSSAGAAITSTSANAGYHYNGGYQFPKYKRYAPKCHWGWVWKKTHSYHKHKHKVWAKIC